MLRRALQAPPAQEGNEKQRFNSNAGFVGEDADSRRLNEAPRSGRPLGIPSSGTRANNTRCDALSGIGGRPPGLGRSLRQSPLCGMRGRIHLGPPSRSAERGQVEEKKGWGWLDKDTSQELRQDPPQNECES